MTAGANSCNAARLPASRLADQFSKTRLAAVLGPRVAPAGYGKTTLLAQWAERNGQAFAWVSVDEADNDPKVLLTYVAEALDAVESVGPSHDTSESSEHALTQAAVAGPRQAGMGVSERQLNNSLILTDTFI